MTAANPHLRAIVIAGVLALVGGMLGFYTLERQNQATTSAPPPVVHPLHHRNPALAKPKARAHATPAAKAAAPANAKPVHHAVAKPKPMHQAVAKPKPAHHAVKPKAAPKPKPKPAARPAAPKVDPVVRAALASGLPAQVAHAFAGHRVLVVTAYSSTSDLDAVSAAEAQAGAKLANAGFAAVDVSREGASGALTEALGITSAPTTIVYRLPDLSVFVQLKGFADRQTVALAAASADPGPTLGRTPWAERADVLCDGTAAALPGSGDGMHTLVQGFLAGLGKLPPPADAADAAQFAAVETQSLGLLEQAAAATARHDAVGAAVLTAKQKTLSQEATQLALKLGATDCAGAF